ncbi:hypothetical protein C8R45DRAFT_1173942 [Mycena sanguinolenta]|nr:hypothetical protein C8R45DRAFT_1173942 [Mycena sanguinolenta]
MLHSPFELPTRVSVACKHCRERKVKCIHDSQETSCLRCQLNGLSCEYVATKKQQERSRNVCPKLSRRNTKSRRKAASLAAISPMEPSPSSASSQASPTSSSPGGGVLDGYSSAGSFYIAPFATPMLMNPMFTNPSLHVYPTDYWPADEPPSPYNIPIHSAPQATMSWDVQRGAQSDMYFNTASDSTIHSMNSGYYGVDDASHLYECYCVCSALDSNF